MVSSPALPGTTFCYNTGLSQVLSAILTQATGMRAYDLAPEQHFRPL